MQTTTGVCWIINNNIIKMKKREKFIYVHVITLEKESEKES